MTNATGAALTTEQARVLQIFQNSPAAKAALEEIATRQREERGKLLAELRTLEKELHQGLAPLVDAQAKAERLIEPLKLQLDMAHHAYRVAYGERLYFQESREGLIRGVHARIRDAAPAEVKDALGEFRKLRDELLSAYRDREYDALTPFGKEKRFITNAGGIARRQAALDAALAQLEAMLFDPDVTSITAPELIRKLRESVPEIGGLE